MIRLTTFVVLALIAMAIKGANFDPDLDNEWLEYKKFYNKGYLLGEEISR